VNPAKASDIDTSTDANFKIKAQEWFSRQTRIFEANFG
jgi:hypothetical protein